MFNPENRTLLMRYKNGDIESDHQFTYVDSNTIKSRFFNLDAKNPVINGMRMTLTRIDRPVTLPSHAVNPERLDEMKVLDRLIGEWRNENTVWDIATPDKPKTEKARAKAESILGGRFVESVVTYEPDNHSDYALAWYDITAKRYRQWFFNGTGGYCFELTGTWDKAANTLTWTSPDGRLEGRWVFKSDDLREFRHRVKATDGKVVNETAGVSHRTAAPAIAPFSLHDQH